MFNHFISDNINCPPLKLTPCQSISFYPCEKNAAAILAHNFLHLSHPSSFSHLFQGKKKLKWALCHKIERKMLHVARKLIYFALFTPFISVIASRRSNFTSIFMGTVICHPSTDFAAQCSACLPKTFSKRGNWKIYMILFWK